MEERTLPHHYARARRRRFADAFLAIVLIAASALLGPSTRAQADSTVTCAALPGPVDPCASDPGPASSGGGPVPSTGAGNPIDLADGGKHQREIDYRSGPAHLRFERVYDSRATDANVGLGPGWRSSWDVRLAALGDGGRRIRQADGRLIDFVPLDAAPEPGDAMTAATPRWAAIDPADGTLERIGRLHRWTLPDGRRLDFHGTWLVGIDWPGPRRITLGYAGGALVSVTDETGRRLILEWTAGQRLLDGYDPAEFAAASGQLARLRLPDGALIHYDYDQRRNLTRVRHPDGTVRRYHYEDPDFPRHLTGLTDRTGARIATWRYDDDGRGIASLGADGADRIDIERSEPDASGQFESTVTRADGARTRYRFEIDPATGAPRLLEGIGPGCAQCPPTGHRHAYDAAGRLLRIDEASGGWRRYQRDARGRVVQVVHGDELGQERIDRRFEYEGDAARPRALLRPSVSPDGEHRLETRYDADGLPLAFVERGWRPLARDGSAFEPIERTTRFAYENERLVRIDGPRDDVADITTIEWDDRARAIGLTLPGGQRWRITGFDAHGRPTGFDDGNGPAYRLAWSARGDLASIAYGALTLRYEHDAEGRLVAVIDPWGREQRVELNSTGRITARIDDRGRRTDIERDDQGRVTDERTHGIDGALVRELISLFDTAGRLSSRRDRRPATATATASTDALDRDWLREYDALGRLARLSDPANGDARAYERDPHGRLTQVTTRQSGGPATIERFSHDAKGRPSAIVLTDGATSTVLHDDFGRLVLDAHPSTSVTRHHHDPAGNPVETRLPDGTRVERTFDAANRLVHERRADNDSVYRYDRHGHLIEARDADSLERFEWRAGRLVTHARHIDDRTFTTRWRYDDQGRIAIKTLPDGQRLQHHYHDSGPERGALRAITRVSLLGLRQETLVGEIDADARDGISGHVLHDGTRVASTWSADGRLATRRHGEGVPISYRFDADARLIAIDTGASLQRYRHDGRALNVGARAFVVGDLPAGHIRRAAARDGRDDAADVDAIDATLRYERDTAGRIVSVHRAGAPLARYRYNAFGERIAKVVYRNTRRPTVTYYLHDGDALSAEADDTGAITRQYVYLDEHRPVALLQRDAVYSIRTDHLGTPYRMTDEAGATVWSARHAPFGATTEDVARIPLDLRLPGQQIDRETGLHYNRHRYYDPSTGRYLSPDPLRLIGGDDLHAYAEGSPLTRIDPLGLAPLEITGDGIPILEAVEAALQRGSLTDQEAQLAREGWQLVPKPRAESDYVRKLAHVLRAAADALGTDPRYADGALTDFVNLLADDAATIAGVTVFFGAMAVITPGAVPAALALATIANGGQFAAFGYGLFDLLSGVGSTDLCDTDALDALGADLAAHVYDAGLETAESVVLGAVGGITKLSRVFALPPRRPDGDTQDELIGATADALLANAARNDAGIKSGGFGVPEDLPPVHRLTDRHWIDTHRQEHVLLGHVRRPNSANPQVGGGHWLGSPNVSIVFGTGENLGNGVTSAEVRIRNSSTGEWHLKSSLEPHTFFPGDWTSRRVMEETEAALASSNPTKPGSLSREGVSPSGVRIRFIFNPKGRLITFYPTNEQG